MLVSARHLLYIGDSKPHIMMASPHAVDFDCAHLHEVSLVRL